MDKSLVLSVTVGRGCYRHIQISESSTLYALHEYILSLFNFDDDHLHAFYMSNRAWDSSSAYASPDDDLDYAVGYTTETKLSYFNLVKGYKFLYLFDFGDEWRFQIKVLRVLEEKTSRPLLLKSVGEVHQYGYYEEEEE